jgi:hypothetical protein
MRCLVTAVKHVNNTRVFSRQLLSKRAPAAMDTPSTVNYCWSITIETVFSMLFVPKCYKQGQSSSGVEVEVVKVRLSDLT